MKYKFNPPSVSIVNLLLVSYFAVGLLLFVIIILGNTFNIPFEYFSNNPESQFNIPIYAGLLQKLRVIFWSGSMSISFLSYLTIKIYSGSTSNTKYIFYTGILTFLLLIDDYFQIHLAIRLIFHIPNTFVYLMYFSFVIFIVYRFKEVIIKSEYKILIVSILLLGFAVIIDLLSDAKLLVIGKEDELEASFKLFGVVTWFVYFTKYSYDNLKFIVLKRL